LTPTERTGGLQVVRNGRQLVSFSCNDYLGLAQDPRVKAAAIAAVERYGTGAGASRLVTGDHPLLGALEARLAAYKKKPAALVFGSGYLANVAIPPALTSDGDLILLDELSHACMFAGAKLSGARMIRFGHNNLDHLEKLLEAERAAAGRCLILTERVFSMDGDRAPIEAMSALAARHDAWLMADDAHGLGVVDDPARAALEMGTLSKALGSYGGYLAASEPVIELLQSRARSFVYTTGLPPASAGAALAALDILAAEPERRARPLALAQRFTRATGLPDAESAIVPLIVGEAKRALALSAQLENEGFLVVAIRPPTVPPGGARLRFAFSAAHTEAEIDRLAEAVMRVAEPVA
ncbi:MAG: aminotransferase class I/II-fold pyridoxal phosphate-dependent enzyme, partial [Gallionella sp.]